MMWVALVIGPVRLSWSCGSIPSSFSYSAHTDQAHLVYIIGGSWPMYMQWFVKRVDLACTVGSLLDPTTCWNWARQKAGGLHQVLNLRLDWWLWFLRIADLWARLTALNPSIYVQNIYVFCISMFGNALSSSICEFKILRNRIFKK